MRKDGPVNFGALEEICDAPILYIRSTVYTEGLYKSLGARGKPSTSVYRAG